MFWGTGRIERAKELYLQAMDLQREGQDEEGYAETLNSLAELHLRNQDYDKALEYANKARELAEKIGDDRLVACILRGIGAIYRQSGKRG